MQEQPVLNDYVQVANSILSKMKSESISSELGTTPEGGCTGDSSGLHHYDVLAPWTCEDCPDAYSQFKAMGPEFLGLQVTSSNSIQWGSIYTPATWMHEIPIMSWPTRCTSCDTRFKKHKRTTNAIVRIFRHPRRMEKFENIWVYTEDDTYRHLKFICLTIPNTIFRLSSRPVSDVTVIAGRATVLEQSLCDWSEMPERVSNLLQDSLKEPFRRKRKRKFWKEHVVYGRWFAEVTWTVHYADGSQFPEGDKGSQWMPGEKELEGAISVEIHPHLHVIAVAKFMDKDLLTQWWENGTQIQAVDSWWSTKQYLTKYLNKQQFEGRNQGTFGKTV